MYNIYDVFENYKFERIIGHDFDKIQEYIENFSINNRTIVLEGYLDDIIDFEPVTEGLKEIGGKIIEFIKGLLAKMQEWFKKVIGIFSKKQNGQEYEKAANAEIQNANANKTSQKIDIKNKSNDDNKKQPKQQNTLKICNTIWDVLDQCTIKVRAPRDLVDGNRPLEVSSEVLKTTNKIMETLKDGLTASGKIDVDRLSAEIDKLTGEESRKEVTDKTGGKALNNPENYAEVWVKEISYSVKWYMLSKNSVVSTLKSMENSMKKEMNDYMTLVKNITNLNKIEETSTSRVEGIVKKAINISMGLIRSAVQRIGRVYNICESICNKAKADYIGKGGTANF
jgi:hypothetical protein